MNVLPFPRPGKPPPISTTKVTSTHSCGWKLTTTGADAMDDMMAALDEHAQTCDGEPR